MAQEMTIGTRITPVRDDRWRIETPDELPTAPEVTA
jgi:hypothetical protein